ncbi:Uncharacterized protein Rs2_36776 [Raphanus sativus]|nr:Uncharacterized protein Rs2_36776 [Raphanus sativus]
MSELGQRLACQREKGVRLRDFGLWNKLCLKLVWILVAKSYSLWAAWNALQAAVTLTRHGMVTARGKIGCLVSATSLPHNLGCSTRQIYGLGFCTGWDLFPPLFLHLDIPHGMACNQYNDTSSLPQAHSTSGHHISHLVGEEHVTT